MLHIYIFIHRKRQQTIKNWKNTQKTDYLQYIHYIHVTWPEILRTIFAQDIQIQGTTQTAWNNLNSYSHKPYTWLYLLSCVFVCIYIHRNQAGYKWIWIQIQCNSFPVDFHVILTLISYTMLNANIVWNVCKWACDDERRPTLNTVRSNHS